MKEQKFKVGDLVYCPALTNEIVKLKKRGDVRYPFGLSCNGVMYPYTDDGKFVKNHAHQSIFHATQEKHALLEQLYGVEFEKPQTPKTNKDIIQAMLDDGWGAVPCLVVSHVVGYKSNVIACINSIEIDGDSCYFVDCTQDSWDVAIPIDPKTQKLIIDYIDGNVVLEK